MANHWKCVECGSMNVERKFFKRFEVSATIYKDKNGKDEEDIGFGTQEEETNESFLHCKDCHNMDMSKFVLMPDVD